MGSKKQGSDKSVRGKPRAGTSAATPLRLNELVISAEELNCLLDEFGETNAHARTVLAHLVLRGRHTSIEGARRFLRAVCADKKSDAPVAFAEISEAWLAAVDPRVAQAMASINWGEIVPHESTWQLLRDALGVALSKSKASRLEKSGVHRTRTDSGCVVYRVDAWKGSKPEKRGKRAGKAG